MTTNNTQHTPGPYLVAYDETIKMWVVFYNQDRPDSLGERDFETGEQLSPIMCDQITVAQCTSKQIADLIAFAPDLLKENEQLKELNRVHYEVTADQNLKIQDLKALNAELLLSLQKCEYALKEMVDDAGKYKGVKYTASTFSLVNAALVSSRDSIEKATK